MSPRDRDLELLFESLCDDELLSRYSSGTLTEEAKAIALVEVHRRGLTANEPEPASGEGELYYGDFVIVARNLNLSEAQVYKNLLEAGGIPAVVGDGNFARAYISLYSANVKVPEAFVAEAKEVFAAFKRGDFSLDEALPPDGT